MYEFLFLALIAVYLTISYRPSSKEPNRSDRREWNKRFLGMIRRNNG